MVLFLFPWEPAKVVQVADIPMVVVVVALGGSVGTSGSSDGRVKKSTNLADSRKLVQFWLSNHTCPIQ